LLIGYVGVGNLQDKASWTSNIGWGEARKSKPCHHFHTWGRLANNWYESGLLHYLCIYKRGEQ